MNRRNRLVLGALCAVIAGGLLLLLYVSGTAKPRLQVLGFTNSSNGAGMVVMFRFYNTAWHTVYLRGPTNGSPFFTREVKTPNGWQVVDTPTKPLTDHTWDVSPRQSCVFCVPVITNQQEGWRVTVRYFDGGASVKLPLLPRMVDLPWKGSGQNLDVSTDPLVSTKP